MITIISLEDNFEAKSNDDPNIHQQTLNIHIKKFKKGSVTVSFMIVFI